MKLACLWAVEKIQTIQKTDELYPSFFKQVQDAPGQIYFQGDKDLLCQKYISIVGSRDMTHWVSLWMEHELLPVLSQKEIGVVSGGARGVDQKAHYLALRASVPTLVILPSGLNQKYPSSIEKLVGPKVGFLSEYKPSEEMRRYFFHGRNRLIAAFSPLTFVVQACRKSGSMITARLALGYGRSVATLPSHPQDRLCGGNLDLLFDGAYMVRDALDLGILLDSYF